MLLWFVSQNNETHSRASCVVGQCCVGLSLCVSLCPSGVKGEWIVASSGCRASLQETRVSWMSSLKSHSEEADFFDNLEETANRTRRRRRGTTRSRIEGPTGDARGSCGERRYPLQGTNVVDHVVRRITSRPEGAVTCGRHTDRCQQCPRTTRTVLGVRKSPFLSRPVLCSCAINLFSHVRKFGSFRCFEIPAVACTSNNVTTPRPMLNELLVSAALYFLKRSACRNG